MKREDFFDIKTIKLSSDTLPESYARERKGRGSHFYNPKSSKMEKLRLEFLKKMKKTDRDFLKKLLDSDEEFYIELEMIFKIPIPKSDSKKKHLEKVNGAVLVGKRPDLDNYIKFFLDAMHTVFYNDDSVVVKMSAEKTYSDTPGTDCIAKVLTRKK